MPSQIATTRTRTRVTKGSAEKQVGVSPPPYSAGRLNSKNTQHAVESRHKTRDTTNSCVDQNYDTRVPKVTGVKRRGRQTDSRCQCSTALNTGGRGQRTSVQSPRRQRLNSKDHASSNHRRPPMSVRFCLSADHPPQARTG